MGLSTQLSSLTASLRGEKGGAAGPHSASPSRDWPPMAISTRPSLSDNEDLPPFAGCFPDLGDRSRSPSEIDPVQPYQPWYRPVRHSPLTYSRSRSRSHSPVWHPWAESHRTSRYSLDLLRPSLSYSHSCSPSQGWHHHLTSQLPGYSRDPVPWRLQHRRCHKRHRCQSCDLSYRSSRSRSRNPYRHYSHCSHDTDSAWSNMADPWHSRHANPRLSSPSHTEPCHFSCGHAEPHQHGSTHVTSWHRSLGRARPCCSSPSHISQHSLHSRSSSRDRYPSCSPSHSKNGHHHSSLCDSPSCCSRSCSRLRSCS